MTSKPKEPDYLTRFREESPAVQYEMLKAKIPDDAQTLGAWTGALIAARLDETSDHAEDAALLYHMDRARGRRAKAELRKAFIKRLGEIFIRQNPDAKIDPAIVEMVQNRLQHLREVRAKDFTYKDSTIRQYFKDSA